MKIKDFFEFGSRMVSTTFHVRPVGLMLGDGSGDVGDAHRLIMGEFDSILFPVIFRYDYGLRLCDILSTGWSGLYLMSDHMQSILEENKLTGWKPFPIRLLDKKDNEIGGYAGFSVTGRCGPIDFSKSEIIQKRFVSNGPLCTYYKGMYVGLDKWDESDFFLPTHYYGTMITAKAAAVIKSNKLTNIRLTNLADIEIDEMTADMIRSKG